MPPPSQMTQTNPDRAERAPDAAQELLAPGKGADGEGDDERVVAGEREIDDDDAEDPRPEFWVHQEDHTLLHQRLQERDQHSTDHDERDSDGKAFDPTDSHLVSPCVTSRVGRPKAAFVSGDERDDGVSGLRGTRRDLPTVDERA